jgi:hypothetical protein
MALLCKPTLRARSQALQFLSRLNILQYPEACEICGQNHTVRSTAGGLHESLVTEILINAKSPLVWKQNTKKQCTQAPNLILEEYKDRNEVGLRTM